MRHIESRSSQVALIVYPKYPHQTRNSFIPWALLFQSTLHFGCNKYAHWMSWRGTDRVGFACAYSCHVKYLMAPTTTRLFCRTKRERKMRPEQTTSISLNVCKSFRTVWAVLPSVCDHGRMHMHRPQAHKH